MASYEPYHRKHMPGVMALCEAEGWSSYTTDAEITHRVLMAPGVTAVVAVEEAEVIGFLYLSGDGAVQGHLSLVAVSERHRRRGIGRGLIASAFPLAGGKWIDLVTDSVEPFYAALPHRRMAGFRLYPEPDGDRMRAPAGALGVRASTDADREWIADVLTRRWGSTMIVSRGRPHAADTLPGFVAQLDGERCGLATYELRGNETELVSLDALLTGQGIGSALLAAVIEAARRARCRRLWLVTSNDNLDAIRFYQRRDLRLVAVHRMAITEARHLKTQIREVGHFGITVSDEIEFEVALAGS